MLTTTDKVRHFFFTTFSGGPSASQTSYNFPIVLPTFPSRLVWEAFFFFAKGVKGYDAIFKDTSPFFAGQFAGCVIFANATE
jgi:hypothetical protein